MRTDQSRFCSRQSIFARYGAMVGAILMVGAALMVLLSLSPTQA